MSGLGGQLDRSVAALLGRDAEPLDLGPGVWAQEAPSTPELRCGFVLDDVHANGDGEPVVDLLEGVRGRDVQRPGDSLAHSPIVWPAVPVAGLPAKHRHEPALMELEQLRDKLLDSCHTAAVLVTHAATHAERTRRRGELGRRTHLWGLVQALCDAHGENSAGREYER